VESLNNAFLFLTLGIRIDFKKNLVVAAKQKFVTSSHVEFSNETKIT